MTHLVEHTVMPDENATALSVVRDVLTQEQPAQLVAADGRRVDLPAALFDVLREAVHAMSQGKAVTIAPHDTVMTTQEAADYLGVSRPTLVKLLEQQMIPFTQPNRHRRVLLSDLLTYQQRTRTQRRQLLDAMTREGSAAHTDGQGFEMTR
jgi:excisionase family DNA binding protein